MASLQGFVIWERNPGSGGKRFPSGGQHLGRKSWISCVLHLPGGGKPGGPAVPNRFGQSPPLLVSCCAAARCPPRLPESEWPRGAAEHAVLVLRPPGGAHSRVPQGGLLARRPAAALCRATQRVAGAVRCPGASPVPLVTAGLALLASAWSRKGMLPRLIHDGNFRCIGFVIL